MPSALFYYDPISEFDRLFEDALGSRLSLRAFPTGVKQAAPQHRDVYRPRLDIHESKDRNTVTATFELPGLKPDSVAIEIQQNRLTVSGDSSPAEAPADSQPQQEERTFTVRERHSGKFSRTLRLPLGIKPEDVKAKMESGVLTVTFPKTLPDQVPTRIIIQ